MQGWKTKKQNLWKMNIKKMRTLNTAVKPKTHNTNMNQHYNTNTTPTVLASGDWKLSRLGGQFWDMLNSLEMASHPKIET